MTETNYTQLVHQILYWGQQHGLHETEDLKPQLVKLTEELGEIAAGVARNNNAQIMDGVGDLLVVLIQFGAVHYKRLNAYGNAAFYLEGCLELAWAQIEKRKGKTVDGIFVQEKDHAE